MLTLPEVSNATHALSPQGQSKKMSEPAARPGKPPKGAFLFLRRKFPNRFSHLFDLNGASIARSSLLAHLWTLTQVPPPIRAVIFLRHRQRQHLSQNRLTGHQFIIQAIKSALLFIRQMRTLKRITRAKHQNYIIANLIRVIEIVDILLVNLKQLLRVRLAVPSILPCSHLHSHTNHDFS